jgi:hypothetical protein
MIGTDAACPPSGMDVAKNDPKAQLKDLLTQLLGMLDDGGDDQATSSDGSDVTDAGAEFEPGDTETPSGDNTASASVPDATAPIGGNAPSGPSASNGPGLAAGAAPGGPPADLKAKLAMLLAAKKGGPGAPPPMA